MNRRNLLKVLSLSTIGNTLATPTVLKLLTSCNTIGEKTTAFLFFQKEQAFMVSQLSDIILPSTKTPGALDIDTPYFLDLVLKEVSLKKDQEVFIKGALEFQNKFYKIFKKDILTGTKEEFSYLLALYFNISSEKQKEVFSYIKSEDAKQESKERLYFIYKFLIFIREYTLFAFYTSKKIGTEVLTYTPVPGKFEVCIPIKEAGNISSL